MPLKNAIIISTKDSENYKSELLYLNNQLNSINYVVTESIILDDEISLITQIQNLKDQTIFVLTNNYEFIFEVLSKAFNKKLVKSTHLTSIYNSKATISLPNLSKIFQIQNHANGINPVCINIQNVFVLPDDLYVIKEIIEKSILPLLSCENNSIGKHFILRCTQNRDQNFLLKFSREYVDNDTVRVIKYCIVKNDNCEQNVILYSSNIHTLSKCISTFKNMVPQNIIMGETADESFLNRLNDMKSEPYVQEAIQVISKCYDDYAPENIFLSFNGGKDCTALLYLVLHVLKAKRPEYKNPLLCLYVQSNNPFPEVELFIEECKLMYNMELVTIRNSVKEGLKEILRARPNLKACLMGTRRTDPFAENLNHFQMCDPGWPEIMRVSPVLDWKYSDIWNFILKCNIPYCNLYNLGYTSLGSTANTVPNPHLQSTNCCGASTYHPAYKLKDGSKERSGRS